MSTGSTTVHRVRVHHALTIAGWLPYLERARSSENAVHTFYVAEFSTLIVCQGAIGCVKPRSRKMP